MVRDPYDFILILYSLNRLMILLSVQYLFFHCVTLTYYIAFLIVCFVSSDVVFGHHKIMENYILSPYPSTVLGAGI